MADSTEAMTAESGAWALRHEAAARKREEESRRKYGRELEPGWEAFFVNDAWEAEGLAKESFEAGMARAADLIKELLQKRSDDACMDCICLVTAIDAIDDGEWLK